MDRSAFKDLIGLITHHAIDLISRELDAAKLLAEDFNQQVSFRVEGTALIEPTGEDCMYDCIVASLMLSPYLSPSFIPAGFSMARLLWSRGAWFSTPP